MSWQDAPEVTASGGWQAAPVVGEDQPINKLGADAFPDFLRRELANADFGTRNIAGFGTALSDVWQGLKEFAGQGDKQQIEANKIIAKEAPVGAIAGNVAMTAIPFGMVGNTVGDAAKVGTILGALEPTGGENARDIIAGKLKGAFSGGVGAAAGQAVANKVGQVIARRAENLATEAAQNAPRTKTLNDALDAGLVAPPNAANPSWANAMAESMGGGRAAVAQAASNQNAPVFDRLAREALHLPESAPLEQATMQQARELAYQAGYKPVAQATAIKPDMGFLDDLIALSPASKGGGVKNAAQSEIDDLVNGLANKSNWTGEQLIRDIRELRSQASRNFKAADFPGGNPGALDLAHAQSAASDALEKLAGRNVGGDAMDLMQQARQYIAKSHDIENAIVEGGGSIDPGYLARRLQRGAPLSDELAVIARFANNFKGASRPAAQIQGPGVNAATLLLSMLTGTATAGPAGGMAGAAAATTAPRVMRKLLLSRASQNRLRDIYRLGMASRVAKGALPYAPVAGAVLGREALSQ